MIDVLEKCVARLWRNLAIGAWGAVAVVALAGCSGSSKPSSSGSQASPTSAPAASTPTTSARPFTGQNSAQFCALAKTYNDRLATVGSGATPAQLRTSTQEGRTAISQAVNAAPAEIKPDVQVISNAFGALFVELEKVNFEAAKVSPAAFAPLQTREVQDAAVRLDTYLRSVCGATG